LFQKFVYIQSQEVFLRNNLKTFKTCTDIIVSNYKVGMSNKLQ